MSQAKTGFERNGGRLVARLSGDLDRETAPVVTADVLGELDPTVGELVVDVADVSFCDSAGLGMFSVIQSRAESLGASMVLQHPSPDLKAILAVSGLNRTLEVRSDA